MQIDKDKENLDLDLDLAEEKIYEVGYLLLPNLTEEEIPAIFGDLKELISSFGGKMISDEMPSLIDLAYPMIKVIANKNNKFQNAYFGWLKFYLSPEKINDLKKKLDLDTNILRFLIIKTVKENTLAGRRFGSFHKKKNITLGKEKETIVEMSTEEIDKEIEAMVEENIN